jgi:hypothetical protein
MRLMYDSVRPNEIPADAEMVALYVDGLYAASEKDWKRFEHSVKVRISAIGMNLNAHVFDCEPGCIWPVSDVVPCVVGARKLGIDPTVYVNEMNHWAAVRQAFNTAGVPQPHYWVANYDGRANYVSPGAVARQYANPEMEQTGGHYDLSAVVDFWPGVDEENEKGDVVAEFTSEKVHLYPSGIDGDDTRTETDLKEVYGRLLQSNWEAVRALSALRNDFAALTSALVDALAGRAPGGEIDYARLTDAIKADGFLSSAVVEGAPYALTRVYPQPGQ